MSQCGCICLDEADKLLSPEFMPLIEEIIEYMPKVRPRHCCSLTQL